ncbi:MAG: phosphoglycerate kinase [Lentisphaeria bacterium]|jgi:phosphoglycerate kinase
MRDIAIEGQRVLIRADLNVPIKDGRVSSDARIKASLPTITLALEKGAKVMITSHLGRPVEDEYDQKASLQPAVDHSVKLLDAPVRLATNYLNGVDVKAGELVVLEMCASIRGRRKTMTRSPITMPLCAMFL